MGIADLWRLLEAEDVVEKYTGANAADHAAIVRAVDGQVIAVDLSMWLMQADQQRAIVEHFSREERCMKVAFERVRAGEDGHRGCIGVQGGYHLPPARAGSCTGSGSEPDRWHPCRLPLHARCCHPQHFASA